MSKLKCCRLGCVKIYTDNRHGQELVRALSKHDSRSFFTRPFMAVWLKQPCDMNSALLCTDCGKDFKAWLELEWGSIASDSYGVSFDGRSADETADALRPDETSPCTSGGGAAKGSPFEISRPRGNFLSDIPNSAKFPIRVPLREEVRAAVKGPIRETFDDRYKNSAVTKKSGNVLRSSDKPLIVRILDLYSYFKLADLVRVWNARAEVNSSNNTTLRSGLSLTCTDSSRKVKHDSSSGSSSSSKKVKHDSSSGSSSSSSSDSSGSSSSSSTGTSSSSAAMEEIS